MPTATFARTERFNIESAATGRTYAISVARPAPLLFTGAVPEQVPILFVLDGTLAFATAVESAAPRAMLGQLQSAVIVGVAYDGDFLAMMRLRTKDLTPETAAGKYADMTAMIGDEFGGADRFLAFLLDELSPRIQALAPEASSTRKILFGHSLAGLFAIDVLMKRPETFETFVASSPSLWWNDFSVLSAQHELAQKLEDRGIRPRVLLTVASREQDEPQSSSIPGIDLEAVRKRVRESRMIDAARELAERLRGTAAAEVEFVCFDGEDHGSVLAAAVGRCSSFALRLDRVGANHAAS